jgi:hypothetical protein
MWRFGFEPRLLFPARLPSSGLTLRRVARPAQAREQ